MANAKPSLLRRIVDVPVELIVGLYVLIDALVTPLFRPIIALLSQLAILRRLGRYIGGLNPYVILILIGVPFVIAELTKVFAVFLMAEGHYHTGMTLFIGAYVVSILVCERIFHAGKAQLLTIGWFAVGYNWVVAVKDRVFAWLRETRVWQAAAGLKQKGRYAMRRLRVRTRHAFGAKPRDAFERQ